MPIIDFRVIPHDEQRYETCGDYWDADGAEHFRVSKLSDERYEWLIFLHELVEKRLLREAGITVEQVDAFDKAYEDARESDARYAPCGCSFATEPGWDVHAPYFFQHRYAERAEQIAAEAMGVSWMAYNKEVESLKRKT